MPELRPETVHKRVPPLGAASSSSATSVEDTRRTPEPLSAPASANEADAAYARLTREAGNLNLWESTSQADVAGHGITFRRQ
jgi:hypothetical protein